MVASEYVSWASFEGTVNKHKGGKSPNAQSFTYTLRAPVLRLYGNGIAFLDVGYNSVEYLSLRKYAVNNVRIGNRKSGFRVSAFNSNFSEAMSAVNRVLSNIAVTAPALVVPECLIYISSRGTVVDIEVVGKYIVRSDIFAVVARSYSCKLSTRSVRGRVSESHHHDRRFDIVSDTLDCEFTVSVGGVTQRAFSRALELVRNREVDFAVDSETVNRLTSGEQNQTVTALSPLILVHDK